MSRSGFPHSFVRSKLSVLPEEAGTLTRQRARASSVVGERGGGGDKGVGGPQSLTAEVSTALAPEVTTRTSEASTLPTDVNSNVTRKRSQSLADIQVRTAQKPTFDVVDSLENVGFYRFPSCTDLWVWATRSSARPSPRRADMIQTPQGRAGAHPEDR